MLGEIVDNIKMSRAELARDLEYCKESVYEETVDELTERVTRAYDIESSEELMEAADWIDRLDSVVNNNSFIAEESAEIERIIKAEGDISFDQMIGIDEEN